MANKKENPTTKFKIDLSEFKKNIADANRQIRLVNSEFKKSTAGLDDWGKSTDGVSEKLKALNKVSELEKTKLENLQKQYELVAKEQGENSKSAQDLQIKINNQSATIAKAENQIKKYSEKLADLKAKEESASEKLKAEIESQSKKVDELKQSYINAVLEQGKNSESAKKLKEELLKLSTSLNENKEKYSSAKSKAEEYAGELKDVGDNAEDLDGSFTVAKGAMSTFVADGVEVVLDKLKEMVTDIGSVETAYNNFSNQTGIQGKELQKYKGVLDDLYDDGMGDSYEDLSETLAQIVQTTKETDLSKIKELAHNVLVMRDTFGFDVQESMRAVNMLMDQFGVSGEEAFNLIVQGAQNGLNKNDDLLDSINEYAVHYKQLGYNADEFFNSLKNGTDTGTFSVDKLGDAMKEFGIRTKDTATSTEEGFQLVGLNANKMRKEFAKGGKSAQSATKKTLKALFSMDNQVKQNQAGVDLFGTMWEDLGIDGVKALMNVNGQADKTKKSMQKINDVAYDDVDSELKVLYRTVQTKLIKPILKDFLPDIEDGIEWTIDNLPTIGTIAKTVGGYLLSIFIGKKVSSFSTQITNLITTFSTLRSATEGLTTAQKLLNIAQSSNPIGAIVTIAGTLVTTFMALNDLFGDNADKTSEMKSKHDELYKSIDEETKKWKELKEERQKASQDNTNEFGYYETLLGELQQITDKNGNIKKGYEERSKVITSTLSDALDTEIKNNGYVITSYNNVIKKVQEAIAVKRAEAQQSAYGDSYDKAKANITEAHTNMTNAKDANEKAQTALNSEYLRLRTAQKKLENYKKEHKGEDYYLQSDFNDLVSEVNGSQQKIDNSLSKTAKNASKKFHDAQEAYLGYVTTIKNYEGVTSAMATGDINKINDAVSNMTSGLVTAENATLETLIQQKKNFSKYYENLKKELKEGTPGVSQEMVNTAKSMVDKADKELAKLKNSGQYAGEALSDGIESKKEKISNKSKKVVDEAKTKALHTAEGLFFAGTKGADKITEGLNKNKSKVSNSAKNAVGEAKKSADYNAEVL